MLTQAQIAAALTRLSSEDSYLWSATNWQLGEDFSPDEWEETFRSFLRNRRPDIAADLGPSTIAHSASRGFEVYTQNCLQDTLYSHDILDRVEGRFGLDTRGEITTFRLASLEHALAGSVVLSRGAFALTVGGVFALGVVVGIFLARRRAAAQPRTT
jgi:hypothetical protein